MGSPFHDFSCPPWMFVSQNKRGGRVRLQPLTAPESEFDHPEKGDALYAMELTLSLEVRAWWLHHECQQALSIFGVFTPDLGTLET